MSQLTGDVIQRALSQRPDLTAPDVGQALALITGGIIMGLGILRLGFIVDFIPLHAIAAFMTGSAISIACGQVPSMFGINSHFNTRQATYLNVMCVSASLIIIDLMWSDIFCVQSDSFKYLGHTDINAALGLTALLLLCKPFH